MTQSTLVAADPRTFSINAARAGLRGHPGYGRVSEFLLRLTNQMRADLDELARLTDKTLTDIILEFIAAGLYGPRADVAVESVAPELTPDVASQNVEKTLAKVADQIVPTTTTQETTMQEQSPDSPNLWTALLPALTQLVGEQSADIWLSSVRFLSADDSRLQLQVPNDYFQEYLTEHYQEVIEEQLHAAHGKRFTVEFIVAAPKSEPTPPTDGKPKNPLLDMIVAAGVKTLDDLEAFEDSLLPGMYRARLDVAAEHCTIYQGAALTGMRRAVGFNHARMAEEVAILKSQRLAEEKARIEFRKQRRLIFSKRVTGLLRQAGNPQSHRQYALGSHWDTDGRPDRGLVLDAARTLKN